MDRHYPTARSFRFVRNVCVSKLEKLEVHELRTILPSLVRMSQCQSVDDGSHWNEAKKEIQKVLCGLEVVNSVVSLLSVDFGCLRQDCVKEQQMQRKLEGTSSANTHSALVESLHEGLALDFERSESSRRLRLVLRELLRIMNKVVENKEFSSYENCELFQCEVYLDNVCDVLCIAQAELPEIFHLDQMAQALLRVPNGPWFICHLVANAPDYFEQVCSCLLTVEDKHNTTLPCYVRTETLCRLCTMNPDYALSIRSEAVQKCCLPELSIKLTLDFKVSHFGRKDLVEFLSGLLLGSDLHVRKWFAQFIKSGQKDHSSISSDALTQLREELLQELVVLTPMGHRQKIKGELQKERKQALGISQGKRRITVDAHDKETLEIIEAMDMSTDFEIVEENTAVPSSEVSHAVMEEQSSTLMKIADENVIYATGLLRLYCTLKGIAGMKLTNDEADELVCLITCRAPSTAAGVRFVTVGLSTVLACNIIGLSVERDKMVVKWMEWLSKEESHVETSGGQHISFGEQLLLMAIHFHSNNLEAIADLVSATLGMRARPGTLTKMKTVFTQELFPEKAITEHAVRVAVTPQLSSSDFGFLPIHCVYHLLKNRAFTKHSVQVKEWIFSQILSSSTPLHPLFVGVIDAFVKSVVMPLPNKHRRQGSSVTVDGFSETKILEVFESRYGGLLSSSTSSSLTTQLLLLYYLLTYKDCCLSNMKSLVSSNHQPADYSLALYSQIPIKYLIQQARKNQEYYRDLYPPLLRLLVTYYPHLCLVEDWLGEEDRAVTTLSKSKSPSTARITNAAVTEALGNLKNSPPSAMLMLLKLSKLDPRFLIHYADVIVQALREAVEPKVSRRIQTLLRDLWMKLNTMIPRRLWLATVNTLCLPAKTTGPLATTPYTDEELTKDPLTVLRCDRKTFRCAPVLSIIIRVLMGYLAASRAMLSQHLLANSNGKSSSASGGVNTEQEREELKSALLSAQESAVVQILLEICLQFKEEKQAKGGSMRHCELREVQCLVCSTLHQMFIMDPKLVKLVHFQGYDPELLAVTVSGIPSMHICLNFITELLNQPELEKQLFAVQLSSYLFIQFPLPKALTIAKYIFQRLTSLSEALPGDKCATFFIPACACVVRFCLAFPPLCSDASTFLLIIGQTAVSRAAGSCGEHLEFSHYRTLLEELNEKVKAKKEELQDQGFDEQSSRDIEMPVWHKLSNRTLGCKEDHSSISSDALTQLREELLQELVVLTPMGHRQKIKGELQKERKQALGISQGKRRITVDAHDKETLEIIEAMDMSTDFEIVEENTAVPSSEVSHAVMEEQSSTLMKIADENVIYATGLLRLYCTLKGIAGMKLTNDEADELVCLITCRAPSTAAGVRFVTVGLSTVLACNIIGLSVERDKMVVKWMEWLSKEESHVETSGGQHISFGEQLLLMAIHFHSNNLEAIADLVSATLGMRARPGTLTKMKTVFTQELFPEKAITEHAVRVAVTPQLSASDFGFLPIHCVYHLLKNRAFTKHSVQVKEWIFSQILSSSTPLHPLFVGVIDAFVKSVVMPLPNKHRRQGSSVTVDGFSETKILEVFESRYGGLLSSSTSSSLTTQLLLLYYLLTYKDCCLSNMKSLVSSNHQPADYSLALYSQIPIKYLIQQARKNQEYYRDLYPPLLRLLVTYYPHLCLVEDWLGEEDRAVTTLSKSKSPSTARITNAAVTEALGNLKNSPPSAMLMLLKLSKLDPRFLIHYADVIVQALREAVEPKVSRRIQTLLRDLWMKLNTMIPRRLWLATVNTLCLPAKTTGPLATTPYTDEELTKDPLTVLRCDRKTFRCAPVLSIIIRVLMGYLAASRAMLSQHLLANSNGKSSSASGGVNTEQEREELKSALLSAQESAVVQILLEICLQFKEEKQAKGGSMRHCELREVQCLVCSTLHQMFIMDPKLVKLVHFQGYDPELLAVTVSGIPSMHICLNFITELLNQPELEKQLFAVQLSSYLFIQFPLPKALTIAKYIFQRLTSLSEALPGDKCATFFIPACACVVRFCLAFPPLCSDASTFLLIIGQTAVSRAAGSCGEHLEFSHYRTLLEELNEKVKAKKEELQDQGFDEQSSRDIEMPVWHKLSNRTLGCKEVLLYNAVKKTFSELIDLCVLKKYGITNT